MHLVLRPERPRLTLILPHAVVNPKPRKVRRTTGLADLGGGRSLRPTTASHEGRIAVRLRRASAASAHAWLSSTCTALVATSIVVDGGVIAWIRTAPLQGAKTLTQAPNAGRFPSPPLRSTCASSHRHACHTRPEPTARLDGGELVLPEGACAAHTSLICPRVNEMGAPSSNAGGHYPRRVPEELQSAPAPFRGLPAGHSKPG